MSNKSIANRAWQKAAVAVLSERSLQNNNSSLIVAPPGSGKTRMGLDYFRQQKAAGRIQKLIIGTPTDVIARNWVKNAANFGIQLSANFNNYDLTRQKPRKLGYDGTVHTYQQLSREPTLHAALNAQEETLLFLDEGHHLSEENSWGLAAETYSETCIQTVILSATPFRRGADPMSMITYDVNGRAVPNYHYTKAQALDDGVIRRLEFHLPNGRMEWRDSDGIKEVSFDDEVSDVDKSRRLRTALLDNSDYVLNLLKLADENLRQTKARGFADAAGAIFAMDIPHAESLATLMANITGKNPVIIHNRIDNSTELIERFNESDDDWLISVRQFGEGADVPRITTVAYLSHYTSRLFLEQAWGRASRVVEGYNWLTGSIFLPNDPDLRAAATTIQEEQLDLLGVPSEPGEPREGDRPNPAFVPIGATPLGLEAIVGGYTVTEEEIISAKEARRQDMEGHLEVLSDAQIAILIKNGHFRLAGPIEPKTGQRPLILDDIRRRKRRQISDLTNRAANFLQCEPKDLHGMWKKRSGKGHDGMGLAELEEKERWLIALLDNSKLVA